MDKLWSLNRSEFIPGRRSCFGRSEFTSQFLFLKFRQALGAECRFLSTNGWHRLVMMMFWFRKTGLVKSPGRSLSQHLDAVADKSGAEETISSLSNRRKEKYKNAATMLSQGLQLLAKQRHLARFFPSPSLFLTQWRPCVASPCSSWPRALRPRTLPAT